MKTILDFLLKQQKRKLLKRCAKCGRKPKIVNCGDGRYAIECFSGRQYHYGISFSRGQYEKSFERQANDWNNMTDEINRQLNL